MISIFTVHELSSGDEKLSTEQGFKPRLLGKKCKHYLCAMQPPPPKSMQRFALVLNNLDLFYTSAPPLAMMVYKVKSIIARNFDRTPKTCSRIKLIHKM